MRCAEFVDHPREAGEAADAQIKRAARRVPAQVRQSKAQLVVEVLQVEEALDICALGRDFGAARGEPFAHLVVVTGGVEYIRVI